MRIRIMSDLHLELHSFIPSENNDFDLLVLAGDIGSHTNGITWARNSFPKKEIIYVPGNHEFYGSNYQGLLKEMRKVALENQVIFLNRNVYLVDDICFIGCILWTDFMLNGLDNRGSAMRLASKSMYDYQEIRYSHMGNLTPMLSAKQHIEYKDWLNKTLEEYKDYKCVVITHHCPHPNSIPDRFQGNLLNTAFTSNLNNMIMMYQPKLWIHGHTHDPFDYMLGDTRVLCNPRGYPNETFSYRDDFIVEV